MDTVLYFEGERITTIALYGPFKNRFGAAKEIGVLNDGAGLVRLANPSQMFLQEDHRTWQVRSSPLAWRVLVAAG